MADYQAELSVAMFTRWEPIPTKERVSIIEPRRLKKPAAAERLPARLFQFTPVKCVDVAKV